MNHLAPKTKLSNRYFVLRHGRSDANEKDLIVSDPEIGTKRYGLAAAGKEQAKKSVARAKQANILDDATIIITSDFLRARETAAIARQILGAGEVAIATELRERYFGEWEMTSGENYHKVWADDQNDASHTNHGVESAGAVQDRVTSLIAALESRFANQKILLVSHGDALQILQTGFEKVSPALHRSQPHLETAEIRELGFRAV